MKRTGSPRKPKPSSEASDLRHRAEARVRGRDEAAGRARRKETGSAQAQPAGRKRKAARGRGTARAPAAAPELDSARLLHELEVHQVELEIQNAELRDARDDLEAALRRYTDLYDFAPTGYFSVDEKGRILEVNLTGAAMLGTERSRIVNRRLESFVSAATRPALDAFLDRVFGLSGKQSCEISFRRDDGTALFAELKAECAETVRDGSRWARATASDISAERLAADAQRRVEALAARNRELDIEIARRRAVEEALRESERINARLLVQARHAQEQMRRLAHGTLEAQEAERKRISRDLHDVVAQSVLEITVHLAILTRESAEGPAAPRSRIEESSRLLGKLVDTVHLFCKDLRPAILDDLGIVPALVSLTKDVARHTGIDIRFTPGTPGTPAHPLTGDREIALYRVVQEALSNAARHAHASRVDVRLHASDGFLGIDVADDGHGFHAARVLLAKRPRRLGLLGMRERLEMVGGTLTIESAPGKGTCVRARVPLGNGRAVRRDAAAPPA